MDKLFFLHIPKTGGSFVRKNFIESNSLKTNLGRENEHWEHTYLIKDFEKYQVDNNGKPAFFQPKHVDLEGLKSQNLKIFTVVRNPFDLLISIYSYDWGHVRKINDIKSFEEFIDLYCNNSDGLIFSEPFKRFLFFPIFDKKGVCRADYILFQENLNNNLKELSKNIGLENPKISNVRQNVSSRKKNYKSYYTDKMVDMVNEKCKIELDLFNYSFDGGNENGSIIKDVSNINIETDYIFKDLI